MIVFDFCGVLGALPSTADRTRVETLAGRSGPAFWAAYWEHRPPYDIGGYDDAEYWSRVTRRDVGRAELDPLVAADTAMWIRPNTELFAYLDTLPGPLAILSNAPAALARAIDTGPWAPAFVHRVFSADIGVAKPEPAAYRILCQRLGTGPRGVVFVDDRPENVAGADAAGLRGVLFTDVPALAEALSGPVTR
jgi:putative hydrolase of the HAD superfamily